MNATGDGIEAPKLQRFAEAYLAMWRRARYRPAAPSDGCGTILLTPEELDDPARLAREAEAYARAFNREEDGLSFRIGCSDFRTNRAFVFVVDAARLLASGPDGNPFALKLLDMAIRDVKDSER